ncbi:MAG: hypothetical protein J2P28_01905, partial [Actinobacteria bacterium]|nr:hypothetical protein [Actinomycetota bacterium]
WWRAGMAALLLVFPVIAVSAALNPNRSGTDVGVLIIFGLACLVGGAGPQVGMIRHRPGWSELSLRLNWLAKSRV